MDKSEIAVIGSIDTVLIFKSVGLDVFGVSTAQKARNALSKALGEYKVVFITDEFAPFVDDIVENTKSMPYPAILVIPSGKDENKDYAMKKISSSVEKALGVNILYDKESK